MTAEYTDTEVVDVLQLDPNKSDADNSQRGEQSDIGDSQTISELPSKHGIHEECPI